MKFKDWIIRSLKRLGVDVVLSAIAGLIAYLVLSNIVPQILEGLLNNGFMKLQFDYGALKTIFSYWHCWVVIFGVRFMMAFFGGYYSLKEEEKK